MSDDTAYMRWTELTAQVKDPPALKNVYEDHWNAIYTVSKFARGGIIFGSLLVYVIAIARQKHDNS